jgi:hypothetical protein
MIERQCNENSTSRNKGVVESFEITGFNDKRDKHLFIYIYLSIIHDSMHPTVNATHSRSTDEETKIIENNRARGDSGSAGGECGA